MVLFACMLKESEQLDTYNKKTKNKTNPLEIDPSSMIEM